MVSQRWLIGIILFFSAWPAMAWVDAANANFVLSRVDERVPGAHLSLVIQRTYNSVSMNNGLFGYGWCSSLETAVVAISPQQMVTLECGEGAAEVFRGSNFETKLEMASVEKLMTAFREQIGAPMVNLQETIINDPVFRARLVRRLNVRYAIPNQSFKSVAGQELSVKDGHFIRSSKGATHRFSEIGKLESISSGGEVIRFIYQNNALDSIQDASGRRLQVKSTADGHIASISAPKGALTKYVYSTSGDLVSAETSEGTEKYAYDNDHNLTHTERGELALDLKYDTANDRVSEISFGDCIERYEYKLSPENTNSFELTKKLQCKGEAPKITQAGYQYATREDGLSRKTRETSINPNGSKIEKKYDSLNRLLSREDSVSKTVLSYTVDGRIQSFKSPTAQYEYAYSKLKMASVIEAKLSSGRTIQYEFDNLTRLRKMKDDLGRSIIINYQGDAMAANSVQVPGKKSVPLRRAPSSDTGPNVGTNAIKEMLRTLDLYEDLYLPLTPALFGGQNAR